MNSEVLNSWKEIASYLGRGVRTVQRWEHDLGLPVRRPRGNDRSAVIALKPDLDRWLHEVPRRTAMGEHSSRHQKLHLSTEQMVTRVHELLQRSSQMQAVVKNTMAITLRLKARQAQSFQGRATNGSRSTPLVQPAPALPGASENGAAARLETPAPSKIAASH